MDLDVMRKINLKGTMEELDKTVKSPASESIR